MVLNLFPAQALDSSVITTVWIGLCVITMLNLRFGLTTAGLVVPGYLVPLLLIKPMSVGVILVEAIATYLIARLLADRLLRQTGSSAMFGRDRFFALLLISVFVRAVSDGWLLPLLGDWLNANGVVMDYQNNLYSFGLVIIALTANQFWNSRLVPGLGVFALYCGLTWAIVRFGLIPFTNFDVSSLGFLYEGLATDILASPKAYLILLTTAFIASRMNLLYGWEFSGILVPALLALQWFQPGKLLISMIETIIVFGLSRLALKLPVFRRMNMEGSRLLLLFFTVGYLYKILLGYLLLWVAPEVKASDYFAFGYLISTLLAIKMHQKELTWQLARTTLQTSLAGIAIASVAGYGLSVAMPPAAQTRSAKATKVERQREPSATVAEALRQRKRDLYAAQESSQALRYTPRELEAFDKGTRAALQFRKTGQRQWLDRARVAYGEGRFSVESMHGWLIVSDLSPERGSGLYALNLRPRTPLTIEVPLPLDEPGVFEAAVQLAQAEGHSALASAGTTAARLPEQRANVLKNPGLPFARFHRLVADGGSLQIRGLRTRPGTDPTNELWIQRELPAGVVIGELRERAGGLQARWGRRTSDNQLRDATTAPFAELMLGRPSRLRLAAGGGALKAVQKIEQNQRIEGFLYAWLIERRDAISPAGSGRYKRPDLGDLLFLELEVLEPLARVAGSWARDRDEQQLQAINAAAATVGYQVLLHRHQRTGVEHAILTEKSTGASRHWGTIVLRMGAASPYQVQIPRPLAERQSFEYGTRLYSLLQARVLIISGVHYAVRSDGAGDVLDQKNVNTAFNLAHQVFTRMLGSQGWVLQVRGRGLGSTSPLDVIASFRGKPAGAEAAIRVSRLMSALQSDGRHAAMAGTRPAARGFPASQDAQSDFSRQQPEARFLSLWVSAAARRDYRSALLADPELARFDALAIPTRIADVPARLFAAEFVPGYEPGRESIDTYIASQNITALEALATDPRWKLTRWLDLDTGRAFLELQRAGGGTVAMRKLDARRSGVASTTRTGDAAKRQAFLVGADGWLVGRSP